MCDVVTMYPYCWVHIRTPCALFLTIFMRTLNKKKKNTSHKDPKICGKKLHVLSSKDFENTLMRGHATIGTGVLTKCLSVKYREIIFV